MDAWYRILVHRIPNIHEAQLTTLFDAVHPQVMIDGILIGPIRRAFHEVGAGVPVAYVGSTGMLEVAITCGSAIARFPRDGVVSVMR